MPTKSGSLEARMETSGRGNEFGVCWPALRWREINRGRTGRAGFLRRPGGGVLGPPPGGAALGGASGGRSGGGGDPPAEDNAPPSRQHFPAASRAHFRRLYDSSTPFSE